MKYKTIIEVQPEQLEVIVKEYFQNQGKNVEKVKFDVSNKWFSDYDGGFTTPVLNKCDVTVYIEDK